MKVWGWAHLRGEGGSPAKLSLSLSAGFVSWRDTKSGSWYIETLDSIFEQWAHCEDLQTLLLRVRLLEGQCVLPRVGVSIQGGLACCDSWGRKELDTTEQMN